jgi:hypothetical protein
MKKTASTATMNHNPGMVIKEALQTFFKASLSGSIPLFAGFSLMFICASREAVLTMTVSAYLQNRTVKKDTKGFEHLE